MKAHSARGVRPRPPAAPRRSGKGERGEAARGEVGARGRQLAGAMAVPTLSPALALVALEELFGGADGEGGAAEEARRVSRAAIDAACEGGDGGLAERVASSGAVGGAQSDSSESAGGAGWRSLAYGEVGFVALRSALRVAVDAALAGASASTAVGGSFLDIGSGTGRATLAAALLCPRLLRLRGIELLPGLHDIAERARMQYEAEIAQRLPAAHATQTVAFEQGDALKVRMRELMRRRCAWSFSLSSPACDLNLRIARAHVCSCPFPPAPCCAHSVIGAAQMWRSAVPRSSRRTLCARSRPKRWKSSARVRFSSCSRTSSLAAPRCGRCWKIASGACRGGPRACACTNVGEPQLSVFDVLCTLCWAWHVHTQRSHELSAQKQLLMPCHDGLACVRTGVREEKQPVSARADGRAHIGVAVLLHDPPK